LKFSWIGHVFVLIFKDSQGMHCLWVQNFSSLLKYQYMQISEKLSYY